VVGASVVSQVVLKFVLVKQTRLFSILFPDGTHHLCRAAHFVTAFLCQWIIIALFVPFWSYQIFHPVASGWVHAEVVLHLRALNFGFMWSVLLNACHYMGFGADHVNTWQDPRGGWLDIFEWINRRGHFGQAATGTSSHQWGPRNFHAMGWWDSSSEGTLTLTSH
jgi:hypothetical protein